MNISITIDQQAVSRDGIYRTCFIVEATTQPRDVLVTSLGDVLGAGFDIDSSAYAFSQTYFAQINRCPTLLLKSRYAGESLQQAFLQGSQDFSFVCTESKDNTERIVFSDFIETTHKLYIYSGTTKITSNKHTVWVAGEDAIQGWLWDSGNLVAFDSGSTLEVE
jgi:hypothetical protein